MIKITKTETGMMVENTIPICEELIQVLRNSKNSSRIKEALRDCHITNHSVEYTQKTPLSVAKRHFEDDELNEDTLEEVKSDHVDFITFLKGLHAETPLINCEENLVNLLNNLRPVAIIIICRHDDNA